MRMHRDHALVLVIDMQQRLAAAVHEAETRISRARVLLEGAAILDVPAVVTEQYPKGLGATVDALSPFLERAARFEKTSFSALATPDIREHVEASGRSGIVVCGMETHVCVLQTVLDLLAAGRSVFVVADACGSRSPASRRLGLRRMRQEGARIVDVEMVLFEWLERAGGETFRRVSRLVK